MSNQSSQSTQTRTQRRTSAAEPSPSNQAAGHSRELQELPRDPRSESTPTDELASQLALLADPATIAGETPAPEISPASRRATSLPAKTLARSASKRAARSDPRTSARSRTAPPSNPAAGRLPKAAQKNSANPISSAPSQSATSTATATATPTTPRTALLDATRAQRLAREARMRERDSREALMRAREALEGVPATRAPSPRSVQTAVPPEAPQWQRLPLIQPPLNEPTTTPPTAVPASLPAGIAAPPAAERALAAELREARATLSIARETTQIQRDEMARLRHELALLRTTPSPEPAYSESGRLHEEITRLTRRIEQLEVDVDRRERERGQLIEAIATHERELAQRTRTIDELTDRYEVQGQALEQARRQFELERRRHTDAQGLLDRLRAALAGIDGERTQALFDEATDLAPRSATPTAHAQPAAIPAAAASEPIAATVAGPGATPIRPADESHPLARAPIFELWREAQIRRHFGPVGIDAIADLLREPLARRERASARRASILLLGPGSGAHARSLADAMLRAGTPSFVLHVADRLAPLGTPDLGDDPLRDTLQTCSSPETAAELESLIQARGPAVIVLRDFLTGQPDVAPWLDVLDRARGSGACLVFLEETGQGEVAPSDEIDAIGQRIWELMPERYTRNPISKTPIKRFREAFAHRSAMPPNGLLRALRARFALELCAQFGFIAEAFVAGPIAGCFDATSARDRRFLEQIAELDDRRVEAGNAVALHLVARVDPLADR